MFYQVLLIYLRVLRLIASKHVFLNCPENRLLNNLGFQCTELNKNVRINKCHIRCARNIRQKTVRFLIQHKKDSPIKL